MYAILATHDTLSGELVAVAHQKDLSNAIWALHDNALDWYYSQEAYIVDAARKDTLSSNTPIWRASANSGEKFTEVYGYVHDELVDALGV